jgi:ribosome-associated protein
MEAFKIKCGEFIELNNLLKVLGFCDSGGIANTVVAKGSVKVDGKIELRKRCKIRAGQIVEFEDRQVIVKE